MSQLHSAGATIFQESTLDEGDESLKRAAAAIWVHSAAGPERLFVLDENLTLKSRKSHPPLRTFSLRSEGEKVKEKWK